MKEFIWVLRAYFHMRKRVGWANWSMVSSLYETYVAENPGCEMSPNDAVDEDLSYWD